MTFVFVGEEKLISFLGKYIANPDKVEREWYQGRQEIIGGPIPVPDNDRPDMPVAEAGRVNMRPPLWPMSQPEQPDIVGG